LTRNVVIGTAGHIDHGKTALIRALTGRDTDRLPEEKKRGISIDLGFTYFDLPGGRRAGIVDVPGHERFVKNMLAGAIGIDLVILVVAADEGVMPQTREHLAIMDLLAVQDGVIALTKVDLVDREWLDLVEEEVRELAAGTFLESAPVVPVSAATGEGIDDLKNALVQAVQGLKPRFDRGVTRLPVDRSFVVRGFGTVVTGTLASGCIQLEDRLVVLPPGREVRVRGLQVHGEEVEKVTVGQRVAVNLSGVEAHEVERGQVLVSPGFFTPTRTFVGRLSLLAEAPRGLKNGSRLRLHVGTAEVMARVVLLDREELAPGDEAFVLYRTEKEVVVATDDRYIVRSYSPVRTIGGGQVIDLEGRYRRYDQKALATLGFLERASLEERVSELLRQAEKGVVKPGQLARRLGRDEAAVLAAAEKAGSGGDVLVLGDRYLIHRDRYQALKGKVKGFLARFHQENPLQPGIGKEELRQEVFGALEVAGFGALLKVLEDDGTIAAKQDLVSLAGHRVVLDPEHSRAKEEIEGLYRQGRFSPPALEEVVERVGLGREATVSLLRFLDSAGVLVRVSGELYFHRHWVDEAARKLRGFLDRHQTLSVAEFRDLLGTSRRYALPLLQYFDARKLTRRVGEKRVLHPRTARE